MNEQTAQPSAADQPAETRPRAVFLDRDGVVNEVVFRDGTPGSPRSIEEFVLADGIAIAVARLQAHGFRVFVVTNQPDVARGMLSPTTLEEMLATVRRLGVDDIMVCPHDEEAGCSCRKPRPGMLEALAERWGISLHDSLLIGDSWKDVEAGRAAGCQTIILHKDYNEGTNADFRVADLAAAMEVATTGMKAIGQRELRPRLS